MTSWLVWAGLLGVLDGIKCSADVVVFGLKETSQPAAFVSETHRQHERQRLHQAGVRLLRQVRIQSRLPQTCRPPLPNGGALLPRGGALLFWRRALVLVLVLVRRLEGLQLSGGGVDLFGAQVSPLLIGVSAHLQRTDRVRFTCWSRKDSDSHLTKAGQRTYSSTDTCVSMVTWFDHSDCLIG